METIIKNNIFPRVGHSFLLLCPYFGVENFSFKFFIEFTYTCLFCLNQKAHKNIITSKYRRSFFLVMYFLRVFSNWSFALCIIPYRLFFKKYLQKKKMSLGSLHGHLKPGFCEEYGGVQLSGLLRR